MRTALISQQLRHGRMIAIIPHHHTIYLRWFVEGGLLFLGLAILRDIAYGIGGLSMYGWIDMVAAIMGLIAIGYLFVRFLNLYMDTIIILDNGMALFTRDGIMHYRTEFFDRVKVDTVQSQQTGLIDVMLRRGRIEMRIDGDISYQFQNVPDPQKRTTRILTAKQHYLHNLERATQEELLPDRGSPQPKDEKVSLLMEALGELLEEYQMKKGG